MSAEASECGLACLAMIARFHGHDIDLSGLRQRFHFSIAGATLRHLFTIADALHLSTRALRVEVGGLARVRVPAILHWNLNHFVVLERVTTGGAVIHDPAVGRRTVPLQELSRRFSGVVVELVPMASFAQVSARAPVRLSSLWSRISGARTSFLQVLALSACLNLVAFALPFQLQLTIDEGVQHADGELLTVLALGFGGLVLLQALIEFLRGWCLEGLTQLMAFQIRGNLVRHLLRLSSGFFEKRHVGDILSRVSSAGVIQDLLTRGAITALIDGLMAVVAGVVMAAYSLMLASVIFVAVAMNLLMVLLAAEPMRRRQEEQISHQAKEQTHLMESVRSAVTVKLLGSEALREAGWRNNYVASANAALAIGRWNIALGAAQTLVNGFSTVLVIYLGANLILDARGFSVGMLFAFLSFRQTFASRAGALLAELLQLRLVRLHLERLADIITAEADPVDLPAHPLVRGEVRLSGVSFRYGSSDPCVLNRVDLDVARGEFIAITGPSGGGKTTLLKVLLGLQRPSEGTILLDGLPADARLWRSWRERCGVVSQDDSLLAGTLADNIAFFDPDLDMQRVIAAAAAAQVHDEIMKMPMQYLSTVGDMGSALSAGQRQRVLLARAFYRQPSVLLLDEGTANLDQETEDAIADLIAELPITRIVVAHRPALIARADRVLLVRGGEVRQVEWTDSSNKTPETA